MSLSVCRLWKLIRIFLLDMGVWLRRLDDEAILSDPILPLESVDVFMEEHAGVLQVVLGCSKSSNKVG